MKLFFLLATVAAVCYAEEVKHTAPKVMVYSRNPGKFEVDNVLICHVSSFHPPDINIQLMRNGHELPGANQTDLAFSQGWHFHLTRSVFFKPMEGDKIICKVTHGTTVKDYAWDPNM